MAPGSPYLSLPTRSLDQLAAELAMKIEAKEKRVEAALFVFREAERALAHESRDLENMQRQYDLVQEAKAHRLTPYLVLKSEGVS